MYLKTTEQEAEERGKKRRKHDIKKETMKNDEKEEKSKFEERESKE